MLSFIYDGSFDGLLQCLFESYHHKVLPDRLCTFETHVPLLMEETLQVINQAHNIERVRDGIMQQLGSETLIKAMRVFLSDEAEIDRYLLLYLRIGFKDPKSLQNQTLESVRIVEKASLRIGRETHKYTGFVRFQQLEDNLLYAPIEPQCNVLPLLAGHFSHRLPNESWIIHDKKRQLALVHDTSRTQIHQVHTMDAPVLHQDELAIQQLWKHFFKSVTISERENPSCQRNHVPHYYRNYLTEFQA